MMTMPVSLASLARRSVRGPGIGSARSNRFRSSRLAEVRREKQFRQADDLRPSLGGIAYAILGRRHVDFGLGGTAHLNQRQAKRLGSAVHDETSQAA